MSGGHCENLPAKRGLIEKLRADEIHESGFLAGKVLLIPGTVFLKNVYLFELIKLSIYTDYSCLYIIPT